MHEQWKKYFDQPLGPPLPSRPVDPEREAELDGLLAEYWKKPDEAPERTGRPLAPKPPAR